MSDALTFLNALWTDKPEGTAVQMWRKSDHKTYTFQNLEAAEAWVANNQQSDVYMCAGLAPREVGANKRRTNMQQVVGIAGVWADIDVNGGPENKTGVASTMEEAQALAESLLAPTVIVNSGYGLQAWWLFDDGPWGFHTVEERDHAQKIVTGFQGALKAEAKRRGYTIDSTFDLARLMRVPGAINHKGGLESAVELLDDGGPRHSRASVEAVGVDYQSTTASKMQMLTGEAIQIEVKPDAQPPMMKLEMLRDAIDEFDPIWKHQKVKGREDWSMSHYEFSLTNYFVNAGWSDQEICDALVFHRLFYEPGDPKGKNRADRLAQTIGKVRATTQHQADQKLEEQRRDEATEQLASLAGDGGLDPVVTISLFNRVIGGPEVKEFIQNGRDPDTARYTLHLANGDEIPIGPVDNLLNFDRFKQRFVVVTRHLPKRIKPEKWDQVVQALLASVHVKEAAEDTRSHRALEWVRSYADRRVSTDRDLACEAHDPFTANEKVHIPLGPLHQFLRKIRGERIADADLKQYLEAAGFERKTVNYIKSDGKKSTRSYYVAPSEILLES